MATLYKLKPAFQALLRPVVRFLAARKATPNQVTLFALALSTIMGATLAIFPEWSFLYLTVPLVLLIRMALNAIDGMLAKEHEMKTPGGAILNELADIISDAILYLPFALKSGIVPHAVIAFVILGLATEVAGLSALGIGATRRFDGPMGKSDRAFLVGVISLCIATNALSLLLVNLLFLLGSALAVCTIYNRGKKAILETG